MEFASMKNRIVDFWTYFRHFGFLAIAYALLSISFLKVRIDYFSEFLVISFILIIFFVIFSRRRRLLPIYALVGRSVNISGIIASFIIVQLLFWCYYRSYFTYLGINYEKEKLLFDSIHVAISLDLNNILEYLDCKNCDSNVYSIGIIQLVLSWLYLGLLLSSLFQKLKHQ